MGETPSIVALAGLSSSASIPVASLRRLRAAGVALAVALATSARGAPAVAQQPDDVLRLPPVIVSAPARLPSAPLPLSQVPSSVEVVSGAELRESGAPSLQEALTRLPGVTLSDEQGNVAQPSLSFRGFQAGPVTGVPQGLSVFIDGVRVNEPDVEEVNFDLIPFDDIDYVEVIRGPSALFGRNTLGGALNIVTRRGQQARELVPEVDGGSFGRQRYRFRLSGPVSPFDYYLSGTLFVEDGWRDRSEVRLGKLFAKLGFRAGGTDAAVSFQRAENRVEQAGSLPLSALRRDRTQNFSPDFFKPLANLATLIVGQDLGERTRLTVNAFVRTLDAEQFNVNLLADNTRSFNHTTSAGSTLQLDHDATLAGRPNRLTAGVEYAHHGVAITVFDEANGPGPRTLASKVRDDQHTAAFYLQDTLTALAGLLRSTDALVLTGGVRWDWVRHGIDDDTPATGGRPNTTGSSRFEQANPRLGVNYNLTQTTGVYFSFGQGFRTPAFLELTCASSGAVCPGLQAGVAPDPALKPVKANHYELGARTRPLRWLGVDVAVFRTDVRDDIFSVSPTGTTGVVFQNIGATLRQGAELAARGALGSRVDASLGYAYTEATFRDNFDLATPRLTPGCVATPCIERVRRGNDLPLVPRHRLNAMLDYHVTPWLTLWVSGAFVGDQRLRGDEANVERTLSSYTVLSTGARVHWKALAAFVTITNVLNDGYETFGTFARNPKLPGAPVEPFLTPAPPIHVGGGLGYRF